MTDLDQAHAAMEAAPDDDVARLRFYERLADTELFMLLAAEAENDQITPELFEIENQKFTLVFDREERLSEGTKYGLVVDLAEIRIEQETHRAGEIADRSRVDHHRDQHHEQRGHHEL